MFTSLLHLGTAIGFKAALSQNKIIARYETYILAIAVGLSLITAYFEISAVGAQIGTLWYFIKLMLALAIVFTAYGFFEKYSKHKQPKRKKNKPKHQTSIEYPASTPWLARTRTSFYWLYISLLCLLGGIAVSSTAVAFVPGDAKDVISISGLLAPLISVAMFIYIAANNNQRRSVIHLSILVPSLLAITLGFVLL